MCLCVCRRRLIRVAQLASCLLARVRLSARLSARPTREDRPQLGPVADDCLGPIAALCGSIASEWAALQETAPERLS